jgi:hypothetical protein
MDVAFSALSPLSHRHHFHSGVNGLCFAMRKSERLRDERCQQPLAGDPRTAKAPFPAVFVLDSQYSTALLKTVYDVLTQLAIPPSAFFVRSDLLEHHRSTSLLRQYFPAPVAAFINTHLLYVHDTFKRVGQGTYSGIEFWTGQTLSGSRSAGYLHIDNDEALRASSGRLMIPVMGSILYLGPIQGLKNGGTVFLPNSNSRLPPRCFRNYSKEHLCNQSNAVVINPTPGRVAIFRGDIAHAVLPCTTPSSKTPRLTFLANAWPHRIASVPRGISSLTPRQFRGS